MSIKPDKKICFVISPIGEEDTETRKRSDQVLKHIITGPVEQLGYEVIRADKISEPGIITTQIIQYIVDASLRPRLCPHRRDECTSPSYRSCQSNSNLFYPLRKLARLRKRHLLVPLFTAR